MMLPNTYVSIAKALTLLDHTAKLQRRDQIRNINRCKKLIRNILKNSSLRPISNSFKKKMMKWITTPNHIKCLLLKPKAGSRYYVYEPSAKGDSIKDGMEITMDFKISLLTGEEVYSSKQLGEKPLKWVMRTLKVAFKKECNTSSVTIKLFCWYPLI